MTSGIRGRAIRSLAAIAALALTAGAAKAQESALDFVKPIVTRVHFQAVVEQLGLDRDQMAITEILFSDYSGSINDVVESADARAEAAGRDTVREALSGRVIVPADELRAMRAAVLESYRDGWADADRLLEDLLFNVELSLRAEQLPRLEEAKRALRRRIVLHPEQVAAETYEYAGDGVDLLELVDEAVAPGGELEPLRMDRIAPIMEAYAAELDRYLAAAATEVRRVRLERRLAGIRRDGGAIRELQRDAIELWHALYDLNQRTAEAVATRVESELGTAAAESWLDRVDAATFPWLFERTVPDLQHEWLLGQPLEAEVADKVADVYGAYAAERRGLRRGAVAMMIRCRLDQHLIVHPMADTSLLTDAPSRTLYEQLVQNSGELAEIDREAAEALERLVTEEQRGEMARAVRSGLRRRR